MLGARKGLLVLAVISLGLCGALAAACGGKSASSPSDAGGGGAGAIDSGAGSFTLGCPATVPWTRTTANGPSNPCPTVGQVCEYGTDFDPGCNTVLRCDDGEWAVPILPNVPGPKCGSSAPPAPAPNAASCPATRAGISDDQSCSASSTCSYDGAICSCGDFCPTVPVGQRPCDPDAGITTNCCDTSKPPTWHCFDGPPSCATPRPHLGDPCAKSGAECAIGPPAECGQVTLQCSAGTWQLAGGECPASSRHVKREITYMGDAESARLRDELLAVRLATYRYKAGDPAQHLGFIIEDMPQGSPAVLASRERVDLYGYVSMTVAAIQEQQKQIDRLERELAETRRACH